MRGLLPASLLLVLLASACEEGTPAARTPYPLTDPQPQPQGQAAADERVVEQIVNATCDREQSCGTIGPGAYFASREECASSVGAKTAAALNPSQCPGGLELHAVQSCLQSMEASQCAKPGDAITRAARCPPADLCIK